MKTKYIAFILFFVINVSCVAEELKIDVTGGRAMVDAILMLCEQTNTIITYEDPPYFGNDLNPITSGFVPKSYDISYTYQSGQDTDRILKGLIDSHAKSNNPGVFSFSKKDEIYNVFPVSYRNENGQNTEYKSLLDTEISMDTTGANCSAVFDQLLKSLSSIDENHRFSTGQPIRAFERIPFDEEIKNRKARDVLDSILIKFNQFYQEHPYGPTNIKWTWHVRYGPPSQKMPQTRHIISFAQIQTGKSEYNKIKVEAARPVLEVVKILEKRFKCVIDYEDPPYEYRSEILNPARNSLAGGILKIDWKNGEQIKNLLDTLTQTTIEPRQDKEMFKWVEYRGNYFVYPYKSKDTSGNPVERKPVMSEHVSINFKDANSLDIVKSICSQVSKLAAKQVELDSIPEPILSVMKKIKVSELFIAAMPAGVILSEILPKMESPVSWELLYQPGSKVYKLNLYEAYK